MTFSQKSIWLQDITWEQARDYAERDGVVLFPIGATEQHGPAAALGLDTYNAIHITEDVAMKHDLLIVPPLWYGDSSHHGAFPGTISLRSETMIAVLKDVFRSLLRHGLRKIVVVNGHKMSNLPALTIAAKDIHEYEYPESIIAIADPWKIARGIAPKLKGGTVEHHAGILEVSQLLYKRPDLVQTEKLGNRNLSYESIFSSWGVYDLFGKPLDPEGNSIDIVWNSSEQRKFVPTGQFSDNSDASHAIGEQYHEYMVGVLGNFVNWLSEYEGPIGQRHCSKSDEECA